MTADFCEEEIMIKIACVGDNVVDINYIDGLVHPGGNSVNVAVYCSQMGHKAAYVGVLADDRNAGVVKDSLAAYGVDYSMCPVMHGETGRCSITLIDGDRHIADENDGGLVKSDPLAITPEILDYLRSCDVIHTDCYAYIDDQLDKLKEIGVPVLYDFSAEWTPEKMAVIGKNIDFVLLSGKEELSVDENRQMLHDAVDMYGVNLAILTMGTKGAWVYDGKKEYTKAPYNVEAGAIDTTGCGDSWISGFITTYVEQMNRLRTMKEGSDDGFIVAANEQDVHEHAIAMAMCIGNLKARYTCRIKGAYKWGVPVVPDEA